jgi:hypothetical protein
LTASQLSLIPFGVTMVAVATGLVITRASYGERLNDAAACL